LTSFFVGPLSIRVISVIRGQDFGCGGAALGNPRLIADPPLLKLPPTRQASIFAKATT
jgi:hypothetical protein